MARPNLFKFATSELSEDAVLCYLADWARPDATEDERLHSLGVEFVNSLFEAQQIPAPPIVFLEVKRQHKNIDHRVSFRTARAAGRAERTQAPRLFPRERSEGGFPPATSRLGAGVPL